MAAIPRMFASRAPAPSDDVKEQVQQAGVGPSIDRLRSLHVEAEETALLANLLGRSLYATVTLALASAAAIGFAGTTLSREVAWAVLMVFAIAALMRAYRHTMAAPFERAALRSFAADLNAILLYAGFAWGAGAFLALSGNAHPLVVLLFSAGVSAAIAAILRNPTPSLYFVVPVAVLTAASALLRALPGTLLTALAVLVGCAAVAGIVAFIAHREARARRVPLWNDASLA